MPERSLFQRIINSRILLVVQAVLMVMLVAVLFRGLVVGDGPKSTSKPLETDKNAHTKPKDQGPDSTSPQARFGPTAKVGREFTRLDVESLPGYPPAFADPEYVAMYRQVHREILAVELAPLFRTLNLHDDKKNGIILDHLVEKQVAQVDSWSAAAKLGLNRKELAMTDDGIRRTLETELQTQLGNTLADFVQNYLHTPDNVRGLIDTMQAELNSSSTPLSPDQEAAIYKTLFEAKRKEPRDLADFSNRKNSTWFAQKLEGVLNGDQLATSKPLLEQYMQANKKSPNPNK